MRPVLSMNELTALAADVAEFQQEADAFAAWCQTPEAKANAAKIMREAEKAWGDFEAECKGGKYNLSPSEVEQLAKNGCLIKRHAIKRGRANGRP